MFDGLGKSSCKIRNTSDKNEVLLTPRMSQYPVDGDGHLVFGDSSTTSKPPRQPVSQVLLHACQSPNKIEVSSE